MEAVTREWFEQYLVPTYQPAEFIPVRGEGSRLWDQAGKEYIDLAGGVATNALGHCHPQLVEALIAQASKLWLVSKCTNEPILRLARAMVKATFADRLFFCNSGAEANEAAFKLARRYSLEHFGPHKSEIISFERSFHGRSLFTVSVGGNQAYSSGFGPTPAQIRHLPFNDLARLEQSISNNTCAVVLEPIQGEGGVIPAEREFMQGVRQLCDRHQALLILDEVQTGMGRTGKLFAYMHHDITPDILTSAKALGGGFPIGAMLAREEVAQAFGEGTHGTTFGGNPLACAIAEQAFALINQPALLSGVVQREQWFRLALEQLQQRHHCFTRIRGQGLLLGAELAPPYQGKARAIVRAATRTGVILLTAGDNVLRFAPALTISQPEIEAGIARLEQALIGLH